MLDLVSVAYATCAGAMLAYLMQPYALIDRTRAKIGWMALAITGAMLWPLMIVILYLIARIGR